jgi:hypothetical protein
MNYIIEYTLLGEDDFVLPADVVGKKRRVKDCGSAMDAMLKLEKWLLGQFPQAKVFKPNSCLPCVPETKKGADTQFNDIFGGIFGGFNK